MPMLHSCSSPGCDTPTVHTYCFEHGLLIRAEIEAERQQAAALDEPIARESAALSYATTAQLEQPSA